MTRVFILIFGALLLNTDIFASQPFFNSSPTATPFPGITNQPVAFSADATTTDHVPLTYTWDFGDGTTGDGASVTHAYTAAGIYNPKITVSTAQGNSISDRIELPIIDGGTFIQLRVDKGKANVSSETGTDSFSFSGVAENAPAGFNPANQTVTVNVLGIRNIFPVNSKGQGKNANGTIKFKLPKNGSGGDIPISLSLKKSSFFDPLVAAGFDPDADLFQGVDFATLISFGASAVTQTDLRDKEKDQLSWILADIYFAAKTSKTKVKHKKTIKTLLLLFSK